MNDLILDRLKEIRQLQNDIKLNELDFKVKKEEKYVILVTLHCLSYI